MTEEEYQVALGEIELLMNAKPDTPEERRLVELITAVETYEEIHYPISLPTLLESIKYYLESRWGLVWRP